MITLHPSLRCQQTNTCTARELPPNNASFLGWISEQPLTSLTSVKFWHPNAWPTAELLVPLKQRAHSLPARACPEGEEKRVCCAHLKYFLPFLYTQLRRHSKHMFNAQMCLSNGKTHLERLKWLWERICTRERIQNGGHKSALWILGKAEEEFRLSLLLCSCSMLCNGWKKCLPTYHRNK